MGISIFNIRSLLMRLQMTSVRDYCRRSCFAHVGRVLIAITLLTAVACATTPELISMESREFAKSLGLPGCRVSVPLSHAEIIEIGRKWEIYTNPESDPEWVKMVATEQPGDQLRLVDCEGTERSFYALIRNNAIMFRYYPLTMD